MSVNSSMGLSDLHCFVEEATSAILPMAADYWRANILEIILKKI